jgi:protein TonB
LAVSLSLHAGLALLAWTYRPFAVMAGGREAAHGTFAVAFAPRRSASAREHGSPGQEIAREEPIEELGPVEEPVVLPVPDVVPIDPPQEAPPPELAPQEKSLLGGARAPEVDWESHPWNFHMPPPETAAAREPGAQVGGKPGTDAVDAEGAADAAGAAVAAGATGPLGSEISSSTRGGNASSPGVEGGNGPVLIRERSKDPEYPQRAQQRRIEGKVLLRIAITNRGAVSSVEVVESSGHSILDRAAVAGVEKWVFEPAKRDGVPIQTEILHYITFKLDDA